MTEEVIEKVKQYKISVGGTDSLGMSFVENVVALANLGAVIQEGTHPTMRFPHGVWMTLESSTPPTPSACVRVFEQPSNKEIFAIFVSPKSSEFSLDADSGDTDLSTNAGVPWTKEQLLSMDFDTQLRAVCKSVGIIGRSKDKMIKDYLAKFE